MPGLYQFRINRNFWGGFHISHFTFQISHLTSHIPTKIYQHTLHFYATTPIQHKMKYGHN